MDMQMPVMDGLEATRLIRKLSLSHHSLLNLPIIAMTANVMHEDKQRCIDAGMDGHIAKPIDPAILQGVLQSWLPQGD